MALSAASSWFSRVWVLTVLSGGPVGFLFLKCFLPSNRFSSFHRKMPAGIGSLLSFFASNSQTRAEGVEPLPFLHRTISHRLISRERKSPQHLKQSHLEGYASIAEYF
jgi:hypothetical protein